MRPPREVDGTLSALVPSFGRALRAQNRSAKTISAYLDTAERFVRFLVDEGLPTDPDAVRREHVEAFIADQLDRWTASTAATRYRCLQQFWRWVVEEGEVAANPMARMRPPTVGDQPVPVFSDDELRRLLATCAGTTFEARRDGAIMWTFIDTGVRLGEMAGMKVPDVDLDGQAVLVTGKGSRGRLVSTGTRTTLALDRYLRERRRHPQATSEWCWLGTKGRLTDSGISQMLERRAAAAGVKGMHAHRFRHSFAHAWLAGGGAEGICSAWPVGARRRCWPDTGPPRRPSGPGTPTAATARGTGCERSLRVCPLRLLRMGRPVLCSATLAAT